MTYVPSRHEHERGAPLTPDCDLWCEHKRLRWLEQQGAALLTAHPGLHIHAGHLFPLDGRPCVLCQVDTLLGLLSTWVHRHTIFGTCTLCDRAAQVCERDTVPECGCAGTCDMTLYRQALRELESPTTPERTGT